MPSNCPAPGWTDSPEGLFITIKAVFKEYLELYERSFGFEFACFFSG